ncbi:MAG: hypothetical protein BMS9Abin29_0590 [Gemmatimonadota bacterium]|nr:MAG: hypothetical protein BMS9Abin29_0590 [Gemmatimonadota bacterium]
MSRARTILFAMLALALSVSAAASGQTPPPPDQGLVMDREVFRYPDYARRNPFAPLLSAEGGGPRFERLVLLGIVFSSDANNSIALFGEGSTTVASSTEISVTAGARTYRLRVGESIGNTTVLEIHENQVVVAVDDFGQSEQHTLELRRRTVGQGGPS